MKKIVKVNVKLFITREKKMTQEKTKFRDFLFCIDEKVLKIPLSASMKEIKIDESTKIAFIGQSNDCLIIIDSASQKEKIEGSLLEVYPFFFALINSHYSISSLDCFTNIKTISTDYFGQISKAQNASYKFIALNFNYSISY